MLWTIIRVSDLNKPITLIIVLFTQFFSQNVLNANIPVISAKSHWRRDLICVSRAEYHRCVWGIFDIGLCSLKHSYPDQFKLVAVCVLLWIVLLSQAVCVHAVLWFYLLLDTDSSMEPFHRTIDNRITHNATGPSLILSEDGNIHRATVLPAAPTIWQPIEQPQKERN